MTADPDVLAYLHWDETTPLTKQGVEFNLASAGTVTIGFVVSNEEGARVKIKSVSLEK